MQNKTINKLQVDLSLEETNLLLEGLSQLPYYRVYQLIGKLQQTAQSQMNKTGKEE